MSVVVDVVSVAAVGAGVIFFLAGSVGMLRFPDPLSRLHAVTKADTLGLGLIVVGLLPRATDLFDAAKMVALWLAALLASSVMGQLAGRIAMRETGAPSARERLP